MMMYKCDRCGKEIPRPTNTENPTRKILLWGTALYDDPNDGGELTAIEVCDSCWDSFQQWKARWQIQ